MNATTRCRPSEDRGDPRRSMPRSQLSLRGARLPVSVEFRRPRCTSGWLRSISRPSDAAQEPARGSGFAAPLGSVRRHWEMAARCVGVAKRSLKGRTKLNWYSVQEAAPLIGLSTDNVYALVARKRIGHRRLGVTKGMWKDSHQRRAHCGIFAVVRGSRSEVLSSRSDRRSVPVPPESVGITDRFSVQTGSLCGTSD